MLLALGALPQAMPFAEAQAAFASGALDGQEGTPPRSRQRAIGAGGQRHLTRVGRDRRRDGVRGPQAAVGRLERAAARGRPARRAAGDRARPARWRARKRRCAGSRRTAWRWCGSPPRVTTRFAPRSRTSTRAGAKRSAPTSSGSPRKRSRMPVCRRRNAPSGGVARRTGLVRTMHDARRDRRRRLGHGARRAACRCGARERLARRPRSRRATSWRAGVRAAVFNDAGIGLDDAGIAGLSRLQSIGMAAVAVSHASARIGDGATRSQAASSAARTVILWPHARSGRECRSRRRSSGYGPDPEGRSIRRTRPVAKRPRVTRSSAEEASDLERPGCRQASGARGRRSARAGPPSRRAWGGASA